MGAITVMPISPIAKEIPGEFWFFPFPIFTSMARI